MKNVIFGILYFFLPGIGFTATAQEARSQFKLTDFEPLRQMQGDWKGMAGNSPFFEGYEIRNDTLIWIRYFSDAALSKVSGEGSVYYSQGNIYHSNGNSTWRLKKKEGNTFYFEPVRNANNSFRWKINDATSWSAEVGSAGRSRIYEMVKVGEN